MGKTKVKSFTLSEILVVMVITAIVVGLAFSVLRLVQKQIHLIRKNYDKSVELALFEQKLWQDFHEYGNITFDARNRKLQMKSEIDSIQYVFYDDLVMRQQDTIKVKLKVLDVFFEGTKAQERNIDAIKLLAEQELPDYDIFVFKNQDVNFYMNSGNGF
ncbi:PulJ/GspJ family protein [Flavobacterium pedocola]